MPRFYKLQPSDLKNLTDAQAGYVAGLLDGEGHLYIAGEYEGTVSSKVRIRITDECIVKALVKITGIGVVSSHMPSQRRKDGGQKKRVYEWTVMRRSDISALLRRVLPLLVLKAERARCLLELESLKDQGIANGQEIRRLIDKMMQHQTRFSGKQMGRDELKEHVVF